MKNKHSLPILLLSVGFILACSGGVTALTPIPQETPASLNASITPSALTTPATTDSPVTSDGSNFPAAAELNPAINLEDLVLARHYYGDPDEQIQGDEICYDVGIFSDDTYTVLSCQPNFTYPKPTGSLDADQSKFLHNWMSTFQSFEEPAINGLLVFSGSGSGVAEFSDQVSMHAMLSRLEWLAHDYVSGGGTPLVVFHARSVLAHQLDVLPDDINIRDFEVIDFSNSCLDAPTPNETCEPVVTQGFRIYLVTNNLMYEYHTDIFGYDIRPLGEPQIAPTQGPAG